MTIAKRPSEALVLTPDFPPEVGGIQLLIARVVEGLTRYDPCVVTVAAEGGREFDRGQRFEVLRAPAIGSHRLSIATLNGFGALQGIRKRPSVVLSAHIVTGPAAVTVGRILRRPVVQYVHAQEVGRRPRLARAVLARADLIIGSSRYSQSLVEALLGPSKNVRVVHPGVDAPDAPPSQPMNVPSIVVVGRLAERYKGHDVLLRALDLVRDQIPDAHLHIVGDGPLKPELEALTRRYGLESATTFHGEVSDLCRDAILADSRVFAMPSRVERGGAGEGFGIVYTEAGARGLPVIAGNAGGALDAVLDGQTGLLVDATNPAAVAGALTALLSDRVRARAMGLAGWEHARSLSWPHVASRVEAVLDEATGA